MSEENIQPTPEPGEDQAPADAMDQAHSMGALLGVAELGGFSPTIMALAESALIGLLVAWASRTDLFYMERRFDLGQKRGRGYVTSFRTGIVFAAG